jgi:mutator family transposase
MATKESEVAVGDIVPIGGAQFEETLASAGPDVLREMIREFAQRMMDADVEVRCNAGYGEVTPDRVNSRNGYRRREWDTRAGTVELAIPKLRAGSYFPSFLEHRRRAGRALASVVATSYLLGVSTRRVENQRGRQDQPVHGQRQQPGRRTVLTVGPAQPVDMGIGHHRREGRHRADHGRRRQADHPVPGHRLTPDRVLKTGLADVVRGRISELSRKQHGKNRSSLGVLSAAALPSSSTASSRATTHTYHSSGPHCSTMVPGSHGHRSRSPCSSRFERGYRTSTGLSSGNLPSLSSSCMTWLHFRSQADDVCHYR